jgi:6-pyruvoyltetrahydropterin/6-carboxytetrahydropterin synthase
MIISRTFTFEASHILPRHPGKCARLHGHTYTLTVAVEGGIDPDTGFVCDYGELKTLVERTIIERVDHQHLGCGDVEILTPTPRVQRAVYGEEFYPSAENLVTRFAEILEHVLKSQVRREGIPEITLHSVRLKETQNSEAVWHPKK